jgi:2-polyprenyl-3-methyl-5-hydroxy-6-metoxy-1,4-benzoquinol methylase
MALPGKECELNRPERSEWLWKEGAGYYEADAEAALRRTPSLPHEQFLRDRRIVRLFREYGRVTAGSEVLEIGCGRSMWLPYLARTERCRVSGIDIEPYALRLAEANFAGAGVRGELYCRDGFDPAQNQDLEGRFDLVYSLGVIEHLEDPADKVRALAHFLKPGGRVLSMVPNLQGLNWIMQRLGSLRVLRAHVIYTPATLQRVHEQAGYETVVAAYCGFFDGHMTNAAGERSRLRQSLHANCCRLLSLVGSAWSRAGFPTGEWRWTAPLVVYVGVRPSR